MRAMGPLPGRRAARPDRLALWLRNEDCCPLDARFAPGSVSPKDLGARAGAGRKSLARRDVLRQGAHAVRKDPQAAEEGARPRVTAHGFDRGRANEFGDRGPEEVERGRDPAALRHCGGRRPARSLVVAAPSGRARGRDLGPG
jgi:hypothetical protein